MGEGERGREGVHWRGWVGVRRKDVIDGRVRVKADGKGRTGEGESEE